MISQAKTRGKLAARGNHVVFWALGLLISLPVFIGDSVSGSLIGVYDVLWDSKMVLLLAGACALASVVSSVTLVAVIFTAPLRAGLTAKYLHVARGGERGDVNILLYYRKRDWGEKIKGYLVVGIFTALGTLAFIIPGIVIALRYSMLGFVFADNPRIGYRDAMQKTRELTKGRKGQIFAFYLSFIGWFLLYPLTFGFSGIYSEPYMNLAFASLYDMYAERDGIVPGAYEDEPKKAEKTGSPAPEEDFPMPSEDYGYDADGNKITF